jgi:hypothetical protein
MNDRTRIVREMSDSELKVASGNAFLADEADAEIEARRLHAEGGGVPFDPRREVSADARHIAARIIKHLWIIFVLLPIVLGILFLLLSGLLTSLPSH